MLKKIMKHYSLKDISIDNFSKINYFCQSKYLYVIMQSFLSVFYRLFFRSILHIKSFSSLLRKQKTMSKLCVFCYIVTIAQIDDF